MDFSLLPPEINSALMYAGSGPGPLTAAATAWETLATSLADSVASFSAVIAGIPWQGPSSEAMRSSALKYMAWLSTTSEKAQQTAAQATAAVAAYEIAFAATIAPFLVAENRAQLAALVATNFLGQNTPAIMATEALYMEMWAQDSSTMTAYSAASTAATSALPKFDPVTAAATPVSIFDPGSNTATTGFAGLLNLLSGSSDSAFGSLLNASFVNSIASSAFLNPGETWAPLIGLASLLPAFASMAQQQQVLSNGGINVGGDGMYSPPPGPGSSSVSANVGTARAIGNLSAPSSWASAGTAARSVNVGTPMITEEIPPSFPAVMPPIVGSPGGKLERPKYGKPVKVIHQHPSVG